MELDVSQANVIEVYQLLVGIVTPRPIAWVTSLSPAGVVNLAPFSFFNVFGANPPIVVFSPTNRRDGSKKDTLNNVRATGEFVIQSAPRGLAEAVNLTSRELPPEQSEVELVGLSVEPSRRVRVPRLREAPTHLECRLLEVRSYGDGPIGANLVIGEVVHIHARDDLFDAQGRIDPRKLQTVARLGGDYWCHTSDLFEQKRP